MKTINEIAKMGGQAKLKKWGREHYKLMGKKSGLARRKKQQSRVATVKK